MSKGDRNRKDRPMVAVVRVTEHEIGKPAGFALPFKVTPAEGSTAEKLEGTMEAFAAAVAEMLDRPEFAELDIAEPGDEACRSFAIAAEPHMAIARLQAAEQAKNN